MSDGLTPPQIFRSLRLRPPPRAAALSCPEPRGAPFVLRRGLAGWLRGAVPGGQEGAGSRGLAGLEAGRGPDRPP